MSWFQNLRWLAYGRRFILAAESIASSLKTIAKYTEDDWIERHTPKIGRRADIHFFDPAKASEEWEKQQRMKHGG